MLKGLKKGTGPRGSRAARPQKSLGLNLEREPRVELGFAAWKAATHHRDPRCVNYDSSTTVQPVIMCNGAQVVWARSRQAPRELNTHQFANFREL